MALHRLSLLYYKLEEGRVPQRYAVFSVILRYYLRIEIINTTNVAKAIINDNASYTLMLITSLPRGKPNTSNYLMYGSVINLYLHCKFLILQNSTQNKGCNKMKH